MTGLGGLDVFLNTFWFLLAGLVCFRYTTLALSERTHAKWLMMGIALAAGGLSLSRAYWAPWYWLIALEQNPVAFYDYIKEFFNIGMFITIAMVMQICGLILHLHISYNLKDTIMGGIKVLSVLLVVSGSLMGLMYLGEKNIPTNDKAIPPVEIIE